VSAVAPGVFKPFAQSFYIDLSDDPDQPPQPIHLGIRGGRHALLRYLVELRSAGVHHVTLNLKYGARAATEVIEEIGQEVLPQLNASQQSVSTRARAMNRR
jgi:hypothetical protein